MPPRNLNTEHLYIVAYDISDPKRLRQVFKVMKGWGLHAQYSVFQCVLTRQSLTELQSELDRIIDHGADQVMFVNVGPAEGRARNAITTLGKGFTLPLRGPMVI